MSEYEVWLYAPERDYPIDAIDEWERLQYTRTVNGVGSFELVLPGSWNWRQVRLDARVIVWRTPANGAKVLDGAYFLRYFARTHTGGAYKTVLRGPCYNDLLARRVIAYAANTAEASKGGYADDVMKDFVYENLGEGCVDPDRVVGCLTIQSDLSAGPVIKKSASYDNLLATLQSIAVAARKAGTGVYFGIVPTGDGWSMEFRTRTGCWGVHHGFPSPVNDTVVFAVERGNMVDPVLYYDLRDEATVAYGLGAGEEEARIIVEVDDERRVGASVLNRRETIYDNPGLDLADLLSAEARYRLDELAYRHGLTFTVQETPASAYGVHWCLGDVVAASFLDEIYNFHIAAVRIAVEGGVERVDVSLRECDGTE